MLWAGQLFPPISIPRFLDWKLVRTWVFRVKGTSEINKSLGSVNLETVDWS